MKTKWLRSLVLLLLLAALGKMVFAQVQHGINLSWNSVTGATGYNIYESATANGTYSKITASPVATTSYFDSTAIDGAAHCYKATTVAGTIESAQSSSVCATAFLVPGAPTGLVATPQ